MMLYQPLIDKLTSLLGHGLVFGSALALSPAANFTSASLTPPAIHQFEPSLSVSRSVAIPDYSQDIQLVLRELEIGKRLLAGIAETTEPDGAMMSFLERLNGIFDSAMAVRSTELPQHARQLAGLLQEARSDLLESVDKVTTWTRLARIVDPATPPVLPERFLARRPTKTIDLSQTDLRIAAYLRSERGPHLA